MTLEALFSFKPSVFLCLVFYVFLALIVNGHGLPNKISTKTNSGPSSLRKSSSPLICSTEACLETARVMLKNMNKNEDPCYDFYRFACGGYKTSPKEEMTAFFASPYEFYSEINDRLWEKIQDLVDSVDGSNFSKAIMYAKNMYEMCMDEETLDSHGMGPLQELIEDFGHWSQNSIPFNRSSSEDRQMMGNQLTRKMTRLIGETGIGLFQVNVEVDAYDTDKFTIALGQIEKPAWFNETEDASFSEYDQMAYEEFIESVGDLVGVNMTSFSKKIVDLLNELMLLRVSDKHPSSQKPKKIQLKDLKLVSPGIDWNDFLGQVMESAGTVTKPLSDTFEVLLYNEDFFQKLASVFSYDFGIIEDLLGIMIIENFGCLTPQRYQEAFLKLTSVTKGATEIIDREEACTDLLKGHYFLSALERLYVNEQYESNVKHHVEEMVRSIQKAFSNTLPEINWLDNKTRRAAEEKIHKVFAIIGASPFIHNDTELNSFYPTVETKTIGAVDYYKKVMSWHIHMDYKHLNEKVNRDYLWAGAAFDVNAYYMYEQNLITFPTPYIEMAFHANRPASINYGALGFVIGHEIGHGFEIDGVDYSADGSLKNWWSHVSRRNFRRKVKCMEKQYSSMQINKNSDKKLNLIGKNTIRDDIADHIGVRYSFAAYKSLPDIKKGGALPGLINFTHDQLFFLSHANLFCYDVPWTYSKEDIRTSTHTPNEYRVNVPLMNSPDFSKAFSCKVGTPMNPRRKCTLW